MIYYPALIERAADGYGLLFPDVPGCVTTGRDAAELMAHAIEALTLHLESLREDGDPIPAPGELDDIRVNQDCLKKFSAAVTSAGVISAAELQAIDHAVLGLIEGAVVAAKAAPLPTAADLLTDVYVNF